MKLLQLISMSLSGSFLAGCCSTQNPEGTKGPEIVSRGYATEGGSYAEVGVQFSTAGDFSALVNPNRWKNPIKSGGSLSWINPVAWTEDAGRTGRILLGEAVIVGGIAGAAVASGSGGDHGGSEPPPPSPPPPTPF